MNKPSIHPVLSANAILEKRATWNDLSLSVESIYFPPLEHPFRQSAPEFSSMHYHEYIELIYMLQGDLWSKIGSQTYSLHTGDLLVIHSNSPHTFCPPFQREYICVKFSPALLYGDDQSLIPLRYQLPLLFDDNGGCLLTAGQLNDQALAAAFASLVEEGAAKKLGFQMVMRGEVLKIFGWILRRSGTSLSAADIPPHTEKLIRRAAEYIEQHLATVTLEETAAHCGLSYSYFSRIFRQTLHKSFSQYVSSLRVEAAARMLTGSDQSVEEIAYAVGFSSASYFISRFRETKGLSPRQFRRAVTVSENQP